MDSERLIQSLRETLGGAKSRDDFVADLKTHPELSIFDNKTQWHGGRGVECQLRFLADWMMKKARRAGTDTVIANLQRYVTRDRVDYHEIMVLAGVNVSSAMPLSAGVELLPFDQLRESFLKEIVRRPFVQSYENYRPRAFLQRPVSYRRMHTNRGQSSPSIREWDISFRTLDDARLCMTAIGPSSPIWLGAWIQADDWVPDLSGGGLNTPELFAIGGYPPEIAENWSALPELHSRWVELSEKERKHLRVSLARINSALRRRELTDAAIDLGIAIDALFLSDRESERGELAFTLRLRAARYLGTDESSRKEISKVFSDLYSLRSAAVHTGGIEPRFDTLDLLERGYQLTGEAIRRVIRQGEPDWRNIVFQ